MSKLGTMSLSRRVCVKFDCVFRALKREFCCILRAKLGIQASPNLLLGTIAAYSAEFGICGSMANWMSLIWGGSIRDIHIFEDWIGGER